MKNYKIVIFKKSSVSLLQREIPEREKVKTRDKSANFCTDDLHDDRCTLLKCRYIFQVPLNAIHLRERTKHLIEK